MENIDKLKLKYKISGWLFQFPLFLTICSLGGLPLLVISIGSYLFPYGGVVIFILFLVNFIITGYLNTKYEKLLKESGIDIFKI